MQKKAGSEHQAAKDPELKPQEYLCSISELPKAELSNKWNMMEKIYCFDVCTEPTNNSFHKSLDKLL